MQQESCKINSYNMGSKWSTETLYHTTNKYYKSHNYFYTHPNVMKPNSKFSKDNIRKIKTQNNR